MSLKQISYRIELSFWQIIISLLSESLLLQRLIRWIYFEFIPRLADLHNYLEHRRVVRWVAAGLGMGLLIGLLISIF